MRAAGARPLATGGWTAVSTHRSCCPRGGETVGLPPMKHLTTVTLTLTATTHSLRLHQHRKMCCRPHERHQHGGWRGDVDVQCCRSGACCVCWDLFSSSTPSHSTNLLRRPPRRIATTGTPPAPPIYICLPQCIPGECHSDLRVSPPTASAVVDPRHQIVPFPSRLLFPVARGLFEGVCTHGTLSHMSGVAAWLSAVGCVW